MKKTLLVSVPLFLLATAFSLAAAGQAPAPRGLPPVAFVSPQRVLNDSTPGKANLARLQAFQVQKTTELRNKQQALEGFRQQLTQVADSSKRTGLLQQEQQLRTELERASVQAQTDLQTLQRQLTIEFQARLKSAFDDLAKGQNIQLVLNADTGVLWAAPGSGIDLTGAVIEQLNAASAPTTPKP